MPTEQSDIEGELVTWRAGLYDADVTICFYHEELFFKNILLIKQDAAT